MKALPIRLKFALWAAALTGLVLVVFSVGTFKHLYDEQLEAIDLALEGESARLLGLPAGQLDPKTADQVFLNEPWLALAHFNQKGQVQFLSPKLPDSVAREALIQPAIHTVNFGENTWRIGAWKNAEDVFVVAYDLAEVHEIVSSLIVGYLISLPLVLLVAGGGGWYVSGRALAPIKELTIAAEGVQAARLDQRISVPKAKDELQRLASVLNAMLKRLEASFTQSQRFAADASHELRTPLTIMQAEIETMLHAGGFNEQQEAKLLSIQEEIGRLDQITEHLLLLARFDSGKIELKQDRIDLSALLVEITEDAEIIGAAHQVQVAMSLASSVVVLGDGVQLRRLMWNLLKNAATYNFPGGKIRCTLEQEERVVKIRVANTGPGIPIELRGRLFERFFRGDASRTQREGHGLGLSLCKEIVQAHGGEIAINAGAETNWTEFVVSLPSAEESIQGLAGKEA